MNSLKLVDVIGVANEAYPDSMVLVNFNSRTGRAKVGHRGDGLANFIVRELCDTFDPKASRAVQVREAARVMGAAARELQSVAARFHDLE